MLFRDEFFVLLFCLLLYVLSRRQTLLFLGISIESNAKITKKNYSLVNALLSNVLTILIPPLTRVRSTKTASN